MVAKSNLFLYAAYTSTCLEDRAWSFCVSLCMTLLGGMRLVSIEQLAEGLGQMLFSGHLGKYFDECSRKKSIRLVVPLNNLSIVLAASFFIACLSVDTSSPLYTIFLVGGMLTSAVNRLFLNAEKLLVGRDWVVVLEKDSLADLNATLTTLDQMANVISPLITGGLVFVLGLRATCAMFGGFSIISMMSKIFFLRSLYLREPGLSIKEKAEKESGENESSGGKLCSGIRSIPTIFGTYYRQTVFAAALGMALMFMTVLGFDGLAVGYGQSIGLTEALLGAFRSFGAAMGIAGALSYAFFEKRLGVRRTGLLGLVTQQLCLIVAVVSIWLPGSPMNLQGYFRNTTLHSWWDDIKTSFNDNGEHFESHIDWKHFTADGNSMDSIFAFLIGIACGRYGLWMADLSITHIMQLEVKETERNTVFGLHNSLCQTFSVLKDLLVIALPEPSTFAICIVVSYLFVTTGHLAYVYYMVKHPNHLKPEEETTEEDIFLGELIEKL